MAFTLSTQLSGRSYNLLVLKLPSLMEESIFCKIQSLKKIEEESK